MSHCNSNSVCAFLKGRTTELIYTGILLVVIGFLINTSKHCISSIRDAKTRRRTISVYLPVIVATLVALIRIGLYWDATLTGKYGLEHNSDKAFDTLIAGCTASALIWSSWLVFRPTPSDDTIPKKVLAGIFLGIGAIAAIIYIAIGTLGSLMHSLTYR